MYFTLFIIIIHVLIIIAVNILAEYPMCHRKLVVSIKNYELNKWLSNDNWFCLQIFFYWNETCWEKTFYEPY